MRSILSQRNRSVVIGVVSVCGLLLVVGLALARRKPPTTRTLAGIGCLEYRTWSDGGSLVSVQRPDRTRLMIHYRKGEAEQMVVSPPPGHPLRARVEPNPDGATLATATRLLPELVALAGGQRQEPSPEAVHLLQRNPPAAFWNLHFTNRPGYYRLFQDGNLILERQLQKRAGRFPCIFYWGPEGPGPDGPTDDLLYCGDFELDDKLEDLPLQLDPSNLHRIKAGDVIKFRKWTVTVEAVDHDNDGINFNNAAILRLQGPLSAVEPGGVYGRPITPEGFLSEVCWPNAVKLVRGEARPAMLSEAELQAMLEVFARAPRNENRGEVVKRLLPKVGYASARISTWLNEQGQEDYWVVRPGRSKDVCVIAAHYDKAGEASQGVSDNASGVVTALGLAKALATRETKLTYAFLFYGAEETNHDWSVWLSSSPAIRDPVRYAVHLEGGGLRGSVRTLRLERPAIAGWLHWRFPALYINQSSGDPRYQKHTAADNLSAIDFALLKGRLDDLVSWLLAIDSVL